MSNPALPSPRTPLLPVALFTAAYLLAAVVALVLTGNREFVFYIVVMLLLIAGIAVLHRRVGLTAPLLWALSLWGLLHMAGGLVPLPASWPHQGEHAVLYSWWLVPDRLKYDQLVHAYGFGTTTWVCWHALSRGWRQPDGQPVQPSFGTLLLCLAAGIGFGALNEVVEFVAVLTIPNTNVGGYENTGWDLVSNLTGAALAAVLIRLTSANR